MLPLELKRTAPKPVGFPVNMVGVTTPVTLCPAASIAPLLCTTRVEGEATEDDPPKIPKALSTLPLALYRVTLGPPCPDETRICPFESRASWLADASRTAIPPFPKVESSWPLLSKRASKPLENSLPTTRTLPSGSNARGPVGTSPEVDAMPFVPKVVSTLPLGLKRLMSPRATKVPTAEARILPSVWIAKPPADAPIEPRVNVTIPPLPNVLST